MDNAGFVGGAVFFLAWLLMMGVCLAGWIILLVAVWRGMKAHESIATSLKQIAARQQP